MAGNPDFAIQIEDFRINHSSGMLRKLTAQLFHGSVHFAFWLCPRKIWGGSPIDFPRDMDHLGSLGGPRSANMAEEPQSMTPKP